MTNTLVLADRHDLLRRLTAATPDWTLVKNASAALAGHGDVDGAAPAAAWPALRSACARWAEESGRGPVIACDHLDGALVLVVVEAEPQLLVQVDLLDHRLLHGSPIICASDLLPAAAVVDGYRRLTPGAEAVARLVLDEWRTGAPPIPDQAREELRRRLQSDPEGARIVSSRLGTHIQQAVDTIALGRWPRASLCTAELAHLARGASRPGKVAARLAAAPSRRACPVLKALADERSVEGDLAGWLEAVDRVHPHTRL